MRKNPDGRLAMLGQMQADASTLRRIRQASKPRKRATTMDMEEEEAPAPIPLVRKVGSFPAPAHRLRGNRLVPIPVFRFTASK